jgi:hypothetical protein
MLQAQGAHPLLLVCHVPHRLKPHPQRLARAIEYRTRGSRRLPLALGTPKLTSRCTPSCACPATRAHKAFRPTNPQQELNTGRLRGKPFIELAQCSRIVYTANGMLLLLCFHPHILHLAPTRRKWIPPFPFFCKDFLRKPTFANEL